MKQPKLDPHLEGKRVSQITKKFVRQILTEKDTLHIGEYNEHVEWKYFSHLPENAGITQDIEKSLREILVKYKVIPDIDTYIEMSYVSISNFLHYSLLEDLRFKEITEVPVDRVEFYQNYWKEQIKEYNSYKKDYRSYLELKQKFEGDG